MRLLALLFCCCLLGVFATEDVENGFFSGRSGDIIVGPIEDAESSFLLLNKNNEPYTDKEIDDVSVADLLSHFVSFLPLNAHTNRKPFPQTNIFASPKASLIFAVDGVGGNTLDSFRNLTLLQTLEKIKINPTFRPHDTLSLLTTLISGTPPSQHGIVGNKWMQQGIKIIHAFENAASQPLVANFPSLLSQSTEGKSLVMSCSSNSQLASTLGTHHALLLNQPLWHNYIFHATSDLQHIDGTFPRTIAEATTFFSKLKKFSPNFNSFKTDVRSVEFQPSTGELRIITNGNSARFDLQDKADLTLFFELELVNRVIARLEKNQFFKELTQDNFSDYFAFTFAGLNSISEKYGSNSPQFRAAVHLLDDVLSEFQDRMNTLYEGKIISQTVLLGKQNPFSALSNAALALLQDSVHEAAVLLPHIYLRVTSKLNEVCNSLKQVIPEVHCNLAASTQNSNRTVTHFPRSLDETEIPVYGNYKATHTEDDLANFHIILWLGIALIVALTLIVYGIGSMNSGKDSLLYRSSHAQSRHHHQA